MSELRKYPRTPHLEGSRLQEGDHDLQAVAIRSLEGVPLVIEEKLDGANAAISCSPEGELLLQSRGHFLRGGGAERQFNLFKPWAQRHADAFREVLGARYVVYGEWLYAKHTVFYDALPHYFLEFDVYDREEDLYLSTRARRALLGGLPFASVPVIAEEPASSAEQLRELIEPSLYKSERWRERLETLARERGLELGLVHKQTDLSDLAEGLYLKWEDEAQVLGRYKFIRASFLQAVVASGSHWADRPIVPNQLAPGVELFA